MKLQRAWILAVGVVLVASQIGFAEKQDRGRAPMPREAAVFIEALNAVADKYVEPVDRQELLEGAIEGMMRRLDPFSAYLPPRTLREFEESLDQEFGGVGIEVLVDKTTKRLTVQRVLGGAPAAKAGLLAGDVILAVDGQDTKGMNLVTAAKRLRGKIGEPVVVTVRHPGDQKPVDIKIIRGRIEIESVMGDLRREDDTWAFYLEENPRIGYIRVPLFGSRTVEELKRALQFNRHPVGALILDLRDSPGGLLSEAIGVCDLFVGDEKHGGVVVKIVGREGAVKSVYRANSRNTILDAKLPMAVLVNGLSAGAAEVVAGCLQDHRRAVIIGQRTYGRGSVQDVIALDGGRSALKLTTAGYRRPGGKKIDRHRTDTEEDPWGVRPNPGFDVEVDAEMALKLRRQRWRRGAPPSVRRQPGEKAENEKPVADPQLRKAIEYLEEALADQKGS